MQNELNFQKQSGGGGAGSRRGCVCKESTDASE